MGRGHDCVRLQRQQSGFISSVRRPALNPLSHTSQGRWITGRCLFYCLWYILICCLWYLILHMNRKYTFSGVATITLSTIVNCTWCFRHYDIYFVLIFTAALCDRIVTLRLIRISSSGYEQGLWSQSLDSGLLSASSVFWSSLHSVFGPPFPHL